MKPSHSPLLSKTHLTHTQGPAWVYKPVMCTTHLPLLLIDCDQVFEETSTFRGEMKTLARQIVESEYDIFVPVDVGHNSEDAVQYTADRVEHYLAKGRFLRDVNFDAEVSVY
jgi:hypothetical protein